MIDADPRVAVGAVQQQGRVALLRGGDLVVVVGRAGAAAVASGRARVAVVMVYGCGSRWW